MMLLALASPALAALFEWELLPLAGTHPGYCSTETLTPWDVDQDGRADLVLHSGVEGTSWWRASASGYEGPLPLLAGVVVHTAGVGDLGGEDDLVVGTVDEAGLGHVYLASEARLVPGPGEPGPPDVGVLRRRGVPALWAAWHGAIYVAEGPDYAAWELLAHASGYGGWALVDVDGDDSTDLVSTSCSVQGFCGSTMTAGPDFDDERAARFSDTAVGFPRVTEGRRGMVVRGADGLGWLYEQTEPWTFAEARPWVTLPATFADLDGDGDDDALTVAPGVGLAVVPNVDGNLRGLLPLGLSGAPLDVDLDGDDDLMTSDGTTCAVAVDRGAQEWEATALSAQVSYSRVVRGSSRGCATTPWTLYAPLLLGLVAVGTRWGRR